MKRIAEKTIGVENVMNTDHPRIAFVERDEVRNQRPRWIVTVVCNRMAEYCETFQTRRDALEYFEALS
jgi:hypothetical protein